MLLSTPFGAISLYPISVALQWVTIFPSKIRQSPSSTPRPVSLKSVSSLSVGGFLIGYCSWTHTPSTYIEAIHSLHSPPHKINAPSVRSRIRLSMDSLSCYMRRYCWRHYSSHMLSLLILIMHCPAMLSYAATAIITTVLLHFCSCCCCYVMMLSCHCTCCCWLYLVLTPVADLAVVDITICSIVLSLYCCCYCYYIVPSHCCYYCCCYVILLSCLL